MARRRARYSRILRGQGAPGSRDRYLQYLAGIDNVSRVGNGRKRSPSIRIQVIPFGIELPTGIRARTQVTRDASQAVTAPSIGARTFAVGAGNTTALRLGSFLPARVIFTEGVSPTGTPEESKTTGQMYLKYGGTSNSHPFGKTTAADDTYQAATVALETELLGTDATGKRVGFVQEVISD